VDERQLIERALAGDPVAERALYEQHVGRVYRMAWRMSGNETLAEDFTQEVFVRAFDRLADFRFGSRFSTWLHRITMTTVLNGLRRTQRIDEREPAREDLTPFDRGREDPDTTLRLSLHQAIDELNEGQRAVLVMHDLEGFTHAEIAGALEIEEGTSKARLSRARSRLREVLVASGVVAPRFPDSTGTSGETHA
jgi:RNA polymerase sigma-70 factor (ECF subfamily)